MRAPRAAAAAGAGGPASARRRRVGDERGEALPAAILFLGVLFMILIGVHVVVIAMARTAVQAAADSALSAAQAAGPDPGDRDDWPECDGEKRTPRVCEGRLGARIAMAAAKSSIIETRPPAVVVEEARGTVTVLVFGGTLTPLLGGVELTAQACGPLDDVPASQLTAGDAWRC
ncbi:MAG: hypothetical protein OXG69_08650 [bacterium]|nr:hypothetical protein [bacterium]